MRLIYGTRNTGKLRHMRSMLQGLDIELVSLNEVGPAACKIDESGNSPMENARIKAMAYFFALKMPVFSCDSGLYVEGLDHQQQPGVHIRRVNGTELTDAQMLEYYSKLAAKFGGRVKARYRNAICLVASDHEMYQHDGDDIASEEFLIVSTPHRQRISRFPLDSLSVECQTGRYYLELEIGQSTRESETTQASGFRNFFERTVLKKSLENGGEQDEIRAAEEWPRIAHSQS